MSKIADMQYEIELLKPTVLASLEEIGDLDHASFSLLEAYLYGTEPLNSDSNTKIQAIIDYMYEKVNIGNWKDVRLFLRKTITIASYLRVLTILANKSHCTEADIKELFEVIDFGIMFGCPIKKDQKLLQNCATILSSITVQNESCNLNSKNLNNNNLDSEEHYNLVTKPNDAFEIDLISCPSMETFYTKYILHEKPVVLEECMDCWPALSKWTDNNYFIKLAGMRTVSIEIGKEYTDSDWTQKLITMKDFVENYIYQRSGPTGYLAQYQLFDQIPELRDDIIIPEYCYFSENDDPVNIMAWYGPKGTVSPLHHDPTKNLLAQVVGEKRIYLYSPNDSEYLYPHEHELLNNTARVDPRCPDLEKYPKYKDAKAYYCVLRPGQMLYIPPTWWHFVESLSVSFSVSFWWK